jgi:NAD(P)-dependent dehydrogenase (short-subunit alcohol dehydrogenase family)
LKQVEDMGGGALAVATDLAREEGLPRLVASAVERFGGVDILINNAAATAGSIWTTPFLELSREDWLYQFAVNLHAPFTPMQLVVPIMERRGGGRIVNVTAGSGEVFRLPEESSKGESIGKFCLHGACRNPRQELGARQQRSGADDGPGAHAGLFRRLREPDGIHRAAVLG